MVQEKREVHVQVLCYRCMASLVRTASHAYGPSALCFFFFFFLWFLGLIFNSFITAFIVRGPFPNLSRLLGRPVSQIYALTNLWGAQLFVCVIYQYMCVSKPPHLTHFEINYRFQLQYWADLLNITNLEIQYILWLYQ